MHRPVHSRFSRNKIVTPGIDDQWEMDHMSMMSYAEYNKNINYVLLVIYVFSKTVWLTALKNTTETEVMTGMEDIFEEGRKPRRIQRHGVFGKDCVGLSQSSRD